MSEVIGENNTKKEVLKKLIKKLHEGADLEQIKKEFKDSVGEISVTEISKVEEELIKDGMAPEKIHKLCDVHIALLRESLEKEEILTAPGHPVHILMQEHKILLKFADDLRKIAQEIKDKEKNVIEQLKHIEEHLKASQSHYSREENVLFPYLEKHGITQPPAMMWMDHDKIREIEKNLYKIIDSCEKTEFQDFAKILKISAIALAEML